MAIRWGRDGGGDVIRETIAITPLQIDPIEFVSQLGTLEQAVGLAGITVLIGILILGLVPRHGSRILETTERSPLISICVGLPMTLVLGSLVYLGVLLSGSSIGIFFAIPMVSIGLTLLLTWTAAGFVAVGGVLTRRLGVEKVWVWLLAGGICSGLAVLYPPAGVVLVAIAASLGVGGGSRVAFNNGGATSPSERVVPPANKV